MCLLIAKLENATIPEHHLENGFEQNSDGAGYAFLCPKSGKVKIKRGFFSYKDFIESWRTVPASAPAIVHFRWATHGSKSTENCHPFRLPNGIAMGHNGIISIPISDEKKSDTRTFIDEVLGPDLKAYPNFLYNDEYKAIIEEWIGGSKLAFLDTAGNIVIFNEQMGHWNGSVWYSNHGYLPSTMKTRGYRGLAATYGWDEGDETTYEGFVAAKKSDAKQSAKVLGLLPSGDPDTDEKAFRQLVAEAESEEALIDLAEASAMQGEDPEVAAAEAAARQDAAADGEESLEEMAVRIEAEESRRALREMDNAAWFAADKEEDEMLQEMKAIEESGVTIG